jgi:uncharacterized protein YdcH (DUF465 family)
MDLHHPLLVDFPELKGIILKLRSECGHFRKMYEEYHRIDDHICRIEEELEGASLEELENLKMKRVALKDDLFHQCWMVSHHHPHQTMVAA